MRRKPTLLFLFPSVENKNKNKTKIIDRRNEQGKDSQIYTTNYKEKKKKKRKQDKVVK